MDILGADLDIISSDDDNNFYEDNPETIFMSDFFLDVINLKNAKHFKNI